MRILRLPAYCAPENTSSAHLQEDRFSAFSRGGMDIVIHTPDPTRGISQQTYKKYKNIRYEEQYDGHVLIHRFPMYRESRNPLLRAVRYILTNLVQYYKGSKEKNIDVIYSSSTPPTQGLLCGCVKRSLSRKYGRDVPIVYNLQDVFPDSLVTAGLTHKGSLIWKIGRKIEDYTYKSSDKIIVISESMKRNICAKGVPEDKIVVIPNWIDVDAVRPVDKTENRLYEEYRIDPYKFTVLYAGNFGAAQGADIVLKAAEALKEETEIQFVIFGGGAEFAAAKEKAALLPNVIISNLLPQERISEVYSLGDVALITCKSGVGTSGMPSKTWSIMACNTPIIASFDMDSELHKILKDSSAGVCTDAEDQEALINEILKAFWDYQKNGKKQVSSRNYVWKYASKEACVGRYIKEINKIVDIKYRYV